MHVFFIMILYINSAGLYYIKKDKGDNTGDKAIWYSDSNKQWFIGNASDIGNMPHKAPILSPEEYGHHFFFFSNDYQHTDFNAIQNVKWHMGIKAGKLQGPPYLLAHTFESLWLTILTF